MIDDDGLFRMSWLFLGPAVHVASRLLLGSIPLFAAWLLGIVRAGTILGGYAALLVIVFARLVRDVLAMMDPQKYVVAATGKMGQETRPWWDATLHVLLFQWQILGTESRAFCGLLDAMNRGFDSWDVPFIDQGKDPKEEVVSYCKAYGVALPVKGIWVWSKLPSEYETMNDFFTRKYKTLGIGNSLIVSPATAVVTVFDAVASMPKRLKNEKFGIAQCGIPDHELYESFPCLIHYLSPADYHCFHAPISGRISTLATFLDGPWSVTVKPYVFKYINILKRNRRVVLIIENEEKLRVAMVIIGGITVDSIRIDEGRIKEGARVEKGQLVGAFARGGSSIATFFNQPVALTRDLASIGHRFKLDVNDNLMTLIK